jgi:hypothetical protein
MFGWNNDYSLSAIARRHESAPHSSDGNTHQR